MDAQAHTQFLSLPQISGLVGRSKATVSRWVRQGKFPKPVRLTENSIAWRDTDYERWAENPTGWTQD